LCVCLVDWARFGSVSRWVIFKRSMYMLTLREARAQSCMLLVECHFESILLLILLDEQLCVIELGPDYEF
jgi:hypothetical protein